MTSFAFDDLRLVALGRRYSSESYQRLACAMLGNSSTTKRVGRQFPSSSSKGPPRTRNLPPYFSIVAGTRLRYSSYWATSWISMSTMTYAAMAVLLPVRSGELGHDVIDEALHGPLNLGARQHRALIEPADDLREPELVPGCLQPVHDFADIPEHRLLAAELLERQVGHVLLDGAELGRA